MNKISDFIKENEKIYNSLKDITYVFQEGEYKDSLIIVFSANNPPNQFQYNYINTLEFLPYNKLFILDNFGEQGAYYIGENLDFKIETSVVSLINNIMFKYNLRQKDVMVVGSSKGGYAALYYGIKYGFGNIIVGGPQTQLGNFLYKEVQADLIIKYLIPETMNNGKEYLNNLLFDTINASNIKVPNIYIHIGSGDHHYKNHVIPFINYIDKYKKKNIMLDVEDYTGHDSLRKYFPSYLSEKLSNILGYPLCEFNPIKLINIEELNKKIVVDVKVVDDKEKYQFAYYFYREKAIIEKKFYIEGNNKISLEVSESGFYKVKVFVKINNRKHMQMSEIIYVDRKNEVKE